MRFYYLSHVFTVCTTHSASLTRIPFSKLSPIFLVAKLSYPALNGAGKLQEISFRPQVQMGGGEESPRVDDRPITEGIQKVSEPSQLFRVSCIPIECLELSATPGPMEPPFSQLALSAWLILWVYGIL